MKRLNKEKLYEMLSKRTAEDTAAAFVGATGLCVMQDGEIVERGTHAELYAADGVYRRLCDMQHQT